MINAVREGSLLRGSRMLELEQSSLPPRGPRLEAECDTCKSAIRESVTRSPDDPVKPQQNAYEAITRLVREFSPTIGLVPNRRRPFIAVLMPSLSPTADHRRSAVRSWLTLDGVTPPKVCSSTAKTIQLSSN